MRARRSAADRFLRKEEARGSNPRESTSSLTSFVQAFPRVVPFVARGVAARASRDPRESMILRREHNASGATLQRAVI